MPEEKEIIAGTVERVIYFSPNTNYIVLKMVSPAYSDPLVATGHLPPHLADVVAEDARIEVAGDWKTTKYGRQFHFRKISVAGEDEYTFFVRLVKGIGPKLAEKLAKAFSREELISVLEHEPKRLLEVPGIGPKKLEQILASWREAKKFRNLYALFEKADAADRISPALIIRIYKHFENRGLDPVAAIAENPYVLTEVPGIGFKTADKIAIALGTPPDDLRRIHVGCVYVLGKTAEDEGHTFLYTDQFEKRFFENLYSDEETAPFADSVREKLDAFLFSAPKPLVSTTDKVGLRRFHAMEARIKEAVTIMARTAPSFSVPPPEKVFAAMASAERRHGVNLTREQRTFLLEFFSGKRRVFGLVGYAGTGKTTVLRFLLEMLADLDVLAPQDIACCAFTGMAARRLREVTGFPFCSTIHSLLEAREGFFLRGPQFPLDQRLVILDEASMVNLPLFFHLLSALRPDAVFLLVGDPAQLPPIGPGNVFSDLIATGLLPHVMLTEIKRQSDESAIALIANEIREGIFPDDLIYRRWEDFAWIEVEGENVWKARNRGASKKELDAIRARNNGRIRETLLTQIKNLRRNGFSEWDVQVLSPMRMGPLGTASLNAALQEIFNPSDPHKPEFSVRGIKLRDGDKIINLENRDLPVMSADLFRERKKDVLSGSFRPSEHNRILNGQVGRFLAYIPETGQIVAHMLDVEPYVAFFDLDDLGKKIDLAYCLTVHKAQGSQYPIVVIPLTTSHWFMLNNQWLYTAVTRAFRFCLLVGDRVAFRRAATNTDTVKRQTWLSLT